MRSWFVPILQFWFGDVDALGRSDVMHSRRWFMKDDAFDREIADRFGQTFADVRAGMREAWLDDPRGRVAYVIVLDQFPRNMFRGTARMFGHPKPSVRGNRQVDRHTLGSVLRQHRAHGGLIVGVREDGEQRPSRAILRAGLRSGRPVLRRSRGGHEQQGTHRGSESSQKVHAFSFVS